MKKVTRQLVNRGVGHFKKIIGIQEEIPRLEEAKKEKNDKSETESYIFTTKLDMNVFRPIDNPSERSHINEWKKITDKNTIFISFVSDPIDSDFYSAKIPGLIQKLDEFGYDYLIRQYPRDRNYHQNCCFKPAFINSIMKEFDKNNNRLNSFAASSMYN